MAPQTPVFGYGASFFIVVRRKRKRKRRERRQKVAGVQVVVGFLAFVRLPFLPNGILQMIGVMGKVAANWVGSVYDSLCVRPALVVE